MKYKHLEISDLKLFYQALKRTNIKTFFYHFLCCLLVWLLWASRTQAQHSDSLLITIKDTLQLLETPEFSPGQAALYSAIFPGLGQAYNRKYWKMPIIYGLGATLGYFIYWNNNRFLLFRDSYLAKENNSDEDPFPNISLEAARLNRDYFKRNRELLIILSIVTHALTIVDATVDAHLKSFDISEDLSFRIKPGFDQIQSQPILGLKLQLNLK
ncbi:MAG: DUF5683 domain-containing protein [Microscillaceae bacterium]|nr:DUF5683 domain-containing protein [Microscillaceae bacterium]